MRLSLNLIFNPGPVAPRPGRRLAFGAGNRLRAPAPPAPPNASSLPFPTKDAREKADDIQSGIIDGAMAPDTRGNAIGSARSPWLPRFALLTAAATLGLIGVGGLVTSHGAGLAVPDWPNTYGYNMFFFPISQWVGGVFYEHTHRLLASGVGLLTAILALWLHGKTARPLMRRLGIILGLAGLAVFAAAPQRWADGVVALATGLALAGAGLVWPASDPAPKWLRRLGLAAFLAVVLQGVLGGLRVVWLKDQIGIFHATLAQLFFALLCALAWLLRKGPRAEGRGPKEARNPNPDSPVSAPSPKSSFKPRTSDFELRTSNFGLPSALGPRPSAFLSPLLATSLILLQLILGATMRHQHAGLAIPDFPLAYGRIWPATDPASVQLYNQRRLEVLAANPITAFQIDLQMVHRLMAVVVAAAVGACVWRLRRGPFRNWAMLWAGLILAQAGLGAATIWSNKAADVATLHVVTGALSLAWGTVLSLRCGLETGLEMA